MYGLITITGFAGLLLIAASVSASEVLRHNPFEQPDFSDASRGGAGNGAGTSPMELRGTVVDGEDSLANIGGEYYRLNNEVSGYRIVQIESGSVTLMRAGNETVLTLHEDE